MAKNRSNKKKTVVESVDADIVEENISQSSESAKVTEKNVEKTTEKSDLNKTESKKSSNIKNYLIGCIGCGCVTIILLLLLVFGMILAISAGLSDILNG